MSPIEQSIKRKIEEIGTPLKDWNVNIYRGILTGYNDAFIISGEKRNELLAACATEEERIRTDELIRPILRGRDIKRYNYEFADLYIIATFPAKHYDIDDYPAVKAHLLSYDIERLEQTGKEYTIDGEKIKARKKTNNQWFETQDSISYWDDFNKQKIVWADLSRSGNSFAYDNNQSIVLNTCYILTASSTEILLYLLGVLNSKVTLFYMDLISSKLDNTGWRWFKQFVEIVPIPTNNTEAFQGIIDSIHAIIKSGYLPSLENTINQHIYKAIQLTEEEIKVIEES